MFALDNWAVWRWGLQYFLILFFCFFLQYFFFACSLFFSSVLLLVGRCFCCLCYSPLCRSLPVMIFVAVLEVGTPVSPFFCRTSFLSRSCFCCLSFRCHYSRSNFCVLCWVVFFFPVVYLFSVSTRDLHKRRDPLLVGSLQPFLSKAVGNPKPCLSRLFAPRDQAIFAT